MGHIQGLFQHSTTGRNQKQVIVNQGCSDGLWLSTEKRSAAADHAQSPITTDLKIGSSQTARLPKALEKTLGTVLIEAGKRKHPARRRIGDGRKQRETDLRTDPIREFSHKIQARQRKGAIPQLPRAVPRLATA